NEDLPSSMKVEKNIVIPPREVHNDLLLDPIQNKLGITSKFINNTNNNHIIQIIPNGFIDILPVNETLKIALHSCLNDNEIIKENIKINNHKNKLKKSNNMIDDTLNEFQIHTQDCREKFFKMEELEFPLIINSDLAKSELFKKLKKNYETKYKSRNTHNSEIASKELKFEIPVLEREYIKKYRFPPKKEKGHRECVNKEQCLMNTFKSFYSNKSDQYIGREFLLKKDHKLFKKSKTLPEINGPCIDCLLMEWTKKVFTEVLQGNLIPEFPINTFRV